MERQAVRCCKHNLKENKEIEQIACQKRAIKAHEQKLENRMEIRACLVPMGKRKAECCQCKHTG